MCTLRSSNLTFVVLFFLFSFPSFFLLHRVFPLCFSSKVALTCSLVLRPFWPFNQLSISNFLHVHKRSKFAVLRNINIWLIKDAAASIKMSSTEVFFFYLETCSVHITILIMHHLRYVWTCDWRGQPHCLSGSHRKYRWLSANQLSWLVTAWFLKMLLGSYSRHKVSQGYMLIQKHKNAI